MKITLCTTQKFLPPLVGGVDVYTYRLGKAFARMGHDVQVIAMDPGVETANGRIDVVADEVAGFAVQRLCFSFAARPKEAFDTGYDPLMETAVRDLLAAQRPDLFVIVNFYMLTLAAVTAAKELDIPVFHVATDFLPICRRATFIRWDDQSCRAGESIKSCAACFVSANPLGRISARVMNTLPEATLLKIAGSEPRLPNPLAALNPYWRQVRIMEKRLQTLRPLRQLIDHVFVPTRFTQRMFVENGFRPEQVHHAPFGVEPDHPLAQVESRPADHTRFLFVGRFQPYKGVHLLLEAFNRLANPQGATLTLYGAPDGHDAYYDRLQAMIAANDRVHFKGKIDPSELAQAFADADYFLLPSTWHENMPLIVLDALQSRTPVISSDIGGVTDVVRHDVNGLLFPMGDVAALQQTLQRAINDPRLVQRLRAGVDLPSIDSYAAQMLSFAHPGRLQKSRRLL